ncbi:hypothetical protein GCK72_018159 [Caenorhabditis remanei]|uniref:Essential MCU regulator, mitochondrial n=1 Tax=Caenorhabditis remanei TaxID=31234 RepID=A0A6A5GAE9_CAERE|nr:hypothetical protein GCK72_018159 [Caenorhabditis remanei]KAF1751605.1 hypothetical protein GCK72_018159 [Caenorhabditis remanei]
MITTEEPAMLDRFFSSFDSLSPRSRRVVTGDSDPQKPSTRNVSNIPKIPKVTGAASTKITLIFSGAFIIGQYVAHKGADYLEHYYDFRGSTDPDD